MKMEGKKAKRKEKLAGEKDEKMKRKEERKTERERGEN